MVGGWWEGFPPLLFSKSVFSAQVHFSHCRERVAGAEGISETWCIANLLLGKSLNTRLGAQRPHCELGMELCIMNKNSSLIQFGSILIYVPLKYKVS